MKNNSTNRRGLSSARRIAPLAFSLTIVLVAAGLLIHVRSASTQSRAIRSTLAAPAFGLAVPALSQTSTFYLHGAGPANNPPTLLLNTTAPTATTEAFKDSPSITRTGGNVWKDVGTWPATPAISVGTLTALSDLHVWLGLKNSDDQGTYFDLRVEAYKNSTLVASGQSVCVTGVTGNPTSAKEVVLAFAPFSAATFNGTSDVLNLKIMTRVGTDAAGGSCGGHSNAAGLRLYFDAVARPSRFNATMGTSDITPPVLTIAQPSDNSITATTQINVIGTFSDQSPTTITVNGVAAAIDGNNFTASVPLAEGQNSLLIVATDAAGNRTESTRHVVRDTVAPALQIAQPAGEMVTNAAQTEVIGTFSDNTPTTITVNGVLATLTPNGFSVVLQLSDGVNTLLARATDAAGNQSETTKIVILDTIAPVLTLSEPSQGKISGTPIVNLIGSVTDRDIALVAVMANDQHLTLGADGSFSESINLSGEGSQAINIVALDAAGNQSLLVRTVVVDSSAPEISGLDPVNGSVIDGPATISGMVTDSTSVSVKVNNVDATMAANGVFSCPGVSLAEGPNQISISAVDAAGNQSSTSLVLVGRDHTPPAAPTLFPTISPTRLAFQTIEGRAESAARIDITGGIEAVTTDAASGTGIFALNVNLAPGQNTLAITATDAVGNTSLPVSLTLISNPQLPLPPAGTPAQINISTGNAQKGLAGLELPRPLVAIVTDKSGAPVPNAVVHFTVEQGDGSFVGGGRGLDSLTDGQGHASVRYLAGPSLGLQQIRADFDGNALTPAIFLLEELQPSTGGVTTVSGVVFDQNLRGLPNVIVRIGGQQTRTESDGRFLVSNVAAGPHQLLELVGRDQVTRPGRWPNITYDFDVLPGVNNALGRPLFLPRVNDGVQLPLDANGVVTNDTVYELPINSGEAPVRVTAKAGTHVSFPPDVTDKRLSVTRIATNRVPMALEDGRATNLYISVQPSGAIFEQPLEISFPNLDRLPASSEVLLMSFDHDAGKYVRVGSGHVTADARSVVSDAGSGIRVGAWHGFPPDPPQPEVTVLGYVQVEGNPELEGKELVSKEAWVEGARAVEVSSPTNAEGVIRRVNHRATLTLPKDSPPRAAKFEAHYQAAAQTITLTPNRVFIGLDKSIDVTAELGLPPTGTATFKWSSDSKDIADVSFATGNTAASVPNKVTIKGGKKAGTTKIKVEYRSTTGVRAKGEVEVNVITVEFEQASDCSGFDKTKVKDPATGKDEPFWLTVVLAGNFNTPQPGLPNTARAKITPSSAASHVTFESSDVNMATVTPAAATTSPETISVTGLNHRSPVYVKAIVNNEEIGRLNIAVRRRIIINVSLHFMSDNAGHHTTRNPASAAALIAGMNTILTKQTGIEYQLEHTSNDVVPKDLGPVVNKNTEWADVVAFRDTVRGDPNGFNQDFYFVWDLENGDAVVPQGQNRIIASARTPGSDALCDDTGTDHAMSHEVLHFAGVMPKNPYPGQPFHAASINELLYPFDNSGCFIPKRDMDAMHDALPQI